MSIGEWIKEKIGYLVKLLNWIQEKLSTKQIKEAKQKMETKGDKNISVQIQAEDNSRVENNIGNQNGINVDGGVNIGGNVSGSEINFNLNSPSGDGKKKFH